MEPELIFRQNYFAEPNGIFLRCKIFNSIFHVLHIHIPPLSFPLRKASN